MRFRAGAVGHSEEMRALLVPFESDRDPLDAEYRQRQRNIEARGANEVSDEEALDELEDIPDDERIDSDNIWDNIFKPLNDDKIGFDDDNNEDIDDMDTDDSADSAEEDDEDDEYMDEDEEDSDGVSIGGEWDGEGGFTDALGYAPL